MEFQQDGKTVSYPAYRWLRDIKTKKEPKAFSWVFTGSRVMNNQQFAADVTGYVMSIVNFDLTLIDIPDLASSANETLEWERNDTLMPKAMTKVWLVIEPAGQVDAAPEQKKPADAEGAEARQIPPYPPHRPARSRQSTSSESRSCESSGRSAWGTKLPLFAKRQRRLPGDQRVAA